MINGRAEVQMESESTNLPSHINDLRADVSCRGTSRVTWVLLQGVEERQQHPRTSTNKVSHKARQTSAEL